MPSSKKSTEKTSMGPWLPMQGPIMNQAVPALQQGYQNATTGPGGQLIGQAQGFASDTMGGKYLDLANNPYLMQAMNAASRATQTYYDALGMRSGRGLRGADFAGAMAQGTEAARLAPLLQLYEAERGRQQQALGWSPQLGMAGMNPSLALSQAYAQLGGLGKEGTTTTKSSEFNPMGIAGTVLGAMVNPMGTAMGVGGSMLGNMGMPGMPFSSMGGLVTGYNAPVGQLPWAQGWH